MKAFRLYLQGSSDCPWRMSKVPFEFIFEALSRMGPTTRPMFGCHGIYVGDKIVLALRRKEDFEADNGVWIATSPHHHESLKKEFPSLRSIGMFGKTITSWQNLPCEADDFEESAMKICELILQGDSRIGKVPKKRIKRIT